MSPQQQWRAAEATYQAQLRDMHERIEQRPLLFEQVAQGGSVAAVLPE